MGFIGQAEIIIDAKSRIAIPAKFRSEIEARNEARTWVSMPRADRSIWLYPIAEFDRLSTSWDATLTPDEDEIELRRILFGYAEKIETDAAGRVTLPRKHLELTGLSGEVIVIGSGTHVEVHDRAEWLSREGARMEELQDRISRVARRRREDER